jgi:hypothetical protein
MAFPINLTAAVDGVTDVMAAHLNNVEGKIGIDGSGAVTSLDYLLKNPGSVDPGHKHTGGTINGFTPGHIPFMGAAALASDADLFWNNTSKRLGIGTITPSVDLALGGAVARAIGLERGVAPDTAGYALTLVAGGATAGATNKGGGVLILSGGISTGSGNSQIQLKVAPPWAAATSDNSPTQVLSIYFEGASSLVYSSNNSYNGNSSVAYPFILRNINNSSVLYAQFGATNPVRTAGGETGQFKISCREAGGWNDRFFFKGSSFGIGTSNFGASAVQVLGIGSGTAPSSAPADLAQMWVADINGTAGYAGFHKRTETTNLTEVIPGVVIKAATGRSANPYEGLIEINQFDNGIYWYADGAWRTIVTW